jgi:hypothetical protein
MAKLTDKNAIKVALLVAIDTEESLVDAYRSPHTGKVDETEPGVIIARNRIFAFKRVLKRYYGITESPDPLKDAKVISLSDLMKGKIEDQD